MVLGHLHAHCWLQVFRIASLAVSDFNSWCWIVLIIIKDVFTFHIISWVLFHRRRPNSQWSNPTCCLSYTNNTMPADALVTLGARASTGMVLTPEAGIFHLQHQKMQIEMYKVLLIRYHDSKFVTEFHKILQQFNVKLRSWYLNESFIYEWCMDEKYMLLLKRVKIFGSSLYMWWDFLCMV